MRILNNGVCIDEKRLFSDVYNSIRNRLEEYGPNDREAYIPIFTDDELDALDADFDFYEGDIEEAEIYKMIIYGGEKLILRIADTYEPIKQKCRLYWFDRGAYGGGKYMDFELEVQRPY